MALIVLPHNLKILLDGLLNQQRWWMASVASIILSLYLSNFYRWMGFPYRGCIIKQSDCKWDTRILMILSRLHEFYFIIMFYKLLKVDYLGKKMCQKSDVLRELYCLRSDIILWNSSTYCVIAVLSWGSMLSIYTAQRDRELSTRRPSDIRDHLITTLLIWSIYITERQQSNA